LRINRNVFVGCTFPPQGNKEPAAIKADCINHHAILSQKNGQKGQQDESIPAVYGIGNNYLARE
jgi:hypothetical protein